MNRIELEQLLSLTIWLPIKDYPNYEVSICGQVRNIKTKRVLRPGMSDGYYCVVLCKNNSKKNHKIHRLVANTFLPKIDVTKNCVDHIDNNRLNNTISNLRWCSSQENNHNSSLSNRNTSGIKGISWSKKYSKWRAQIMINYKYISIGYFDDINDAKIARQNKSSELFGIFQNSCEK